MNVLSNDFAMVILTLIPILLQDMGGQLNDLTFCTDGLLALDRGTLYMESGNLMPGLQSSDTSLESDIELRLEHSVPWAQH